jgi:hypothetical protein
MSATASKALPLRTLRVHRAFSLMRFPVGQKGRSSRGCGVSREQ